MPDFSLLPEVVWVQILSYLPLSARSRTSLTCSSLLNVFNRASVWQTTKIVLLGDLNLMDSPRNHPSISDLEQCSVMVSKFGKFLQKLTIIIIGNFFKMENPSLKLLQQIADTCNVEQLTLRIGCLIRKNDTSLKRPSEEELSPLTSIISKSSKLKYLVLESWPIFPDDDCCDILSCIQENNKMKELRKLNLFCPPVRDDTWISLNICLPPARQTMSTLSFLSNLKHLSIRSEMLTSEIIAGLSKTGRQSLSSLEITVTYSRPDANDHNSNHKIMPEAWKKLLDTSPHLAVKLVFGNTMPSYEMIEFLKSEMPVKEVTFMKYARYESHILQHLVANYDKQLCKFSDYGDGCSNTADLVALVTQCNNLVNFLYNGKLQDNLVLNIFELRKQKWQNFQVIKVVSVFVSIPMSL